MATTGAVSWMFKDQGLMELIVNDKSEEDIEADVIEAEAEEIEFGVGEENKKLAFITTNFEDIGSVRDYLLEKSYELQNIKKHKEPETRVTLNLDEAKKLFHIIEKIEEDEDVTEVFHNAEISEKIMNQL